jgi:hypothetical protein
MGVPCGNGGDVVEIAHGDRAVGEALRRPGDAVAQLAAIPKAPAEDVTILSERARVHAAAADLGDLVEADDGDRRVAFGRRAIAEAADFVIPETADAAVVAERADVGRRGGDADDRRQPADSASRQASAPS